MPLCGNLGPILYRYMFGMREWLDGSNTRLVSHNRRIGGLNTDAQHTQQHAAPFRLFAFFVYHVHTGCYCRGRSAYRALENERLPALMC